MHQPQSVTVGDWQQTKDVLVHEDLLREHLGVQFLLF